MLIFFGMIIFGFAVAMILLSIRSQVMTNKFAISLSLMLVDAGIPLSLIFTYLYLDARIYLMRLKKNGFEVPQDARKYDRDLNNLPRTGEAVENRYAGDSRIAMIVSLIGFGVFLAADALYLLKWYKLEPDSIALAIIIFMGCCLFLVIAFVFGRQADKNRYIDNVDIRIPSDTRKTRFGIFSAVFAVIVLSLIGIFGVMTAHSMTDYIHKTHLESEAARVYEEAMETAVTAGADVTEAPSDVDTVS